MSNLDLFSGHADLYAQFRIDYPPELYDFIYSFVKEYHRAWDCATGNGQVAGVLAERFETVDGTDISAQQLEKAVRKPNIIYLPCPAEQTPFPDRQFDLITVAQALHWFDVDAFHQEVRRVARPGAVIAEWGYGHNRVSETVDPVVMDFYLNTIGPYWDGQRTHVEDHYARLPFPFADAQRAEFSVRRSWTADRFLNYLRTWSSVQKYIRQHQSDPVLLIADRLTALWGPEERDVSFPVFLRIGSVR
ncbi:class I SAM-dependent methyltransferase [Larkinella soli]|uniref:class I SAM-dependent methyltransferase n=1 Tax=Larkinella soli TaxID=1770527 RepID=UPI000FFCBE5E|nr:class I SAM-dependent methyltransferase [Larkinella soli]